VEFEDTRKNYGETRVICYGLLDRSTPVQPTDTTQYGSRGGNRTERCDRHCGRAAASVGAVDATAGAKDSRQRRATPIQAASRAVHSSGTAVTRDAVDASSSIPGALVNTDA
jgi:hypothetical protein